MSKLTDSLAFMKKVNSRELTILKLLDKYNINVSPKIININESSRIVTFIKYEKTLLECAYEQNAFFLNNIDIVINKVCNLINSLHAYNIVHGDIHADNIVINWSRVFNRSIKTQDFI